MKRVLFYTVLLLQIGILSIFAWQYFLMDHYGNTATLLTEQMDFSWHKSNDLHTNIHLTYEIHKISDDQWQISEELNLNDLVYVLLELGEDGIFHVKKASTKKMKQENQQLLLIGKYQHYTSHSRQHKVHYGIEKIIEKDFNQDLVSHTPMKVTIKIAPWKQMKIIDISR